MTERLLLVAGGVCAFVGAGLMGYKGVAILVTGEQPDHAFEVAPFFFGVSALLLVSALIDDLTRYVGFCWRWVGLPLSQARLLQSPTSQVEKTTLVIWGTW
jgi:hypothetical protein